MPIYVMDDGCIFNTIQDAINERVEPSEIFHYEKNISSIHNLISKHFNKEVYVSDDYINYKIKDRYIYDHLSSPEISSLRDSFLSLFITLNRLTKFDSESFFDEKIFEEDDFFASSFIQEKFSGFISNRDIIDSNWWNKDLHHKLNDSDEAIDLFKNKKLSENENYQFFFKNKHVFWPNCYFHTGSTNRFSNLCVSELEHLPNLINHLDFLNREATKLYSADPLPDNFIAAAASKGVELSPESPKTRQNHAAMAQRNITINDKKILCEWHTKLTPTAGRVHFNLNISEPDAISEVVNGKVIIGIYTKHFDT
ncbi:hypothetical protein [Shewanella algae]|uniref:hypothetical protein n=1 Tax=Shewanella algae TaxID=38313 RepID=UPI0031F50782